MYSPEIHTTEAPGGSAPGGLRNQDECVSLQEKVGVANCESFRWRPIGTNKAIGSQLQRVPREGGTSEMAERRNQMATRYSHPEVGVEFSRMESTWIRKP